MEEVNSPAKVSADSSTHEKVDRKSSNYFAVVCAFFFFAVIVLFAILPPSEWAAAVPYPLDDEGWDAYCNMSMKYAFFSSRQPNGWLSARVNNIPKFREVVKTLGGSDAQV